MTEFPLISIVTPVYNCAEYIRDCIESVLSQNYPNFEHIIVDGASNDGTIEILKEYDHLKWISEPDDGEADALNKAIKMASGEIIGWLNGDDYYCENAFDFMLKEMYPQGKHFIVQGNCRFVDDDGKFLSLHTPSADLTIPLLTRFWESGRFPRQPSVFYSKRVFDEIGLFRTDFHFGVDYEHWLRCAEKFEFFYINETFSVARIRIHCKSAEDIPGQYRALWNICKPYRLRLNRNDKVDFWRGYLLKHKPFVTFQPLRKRLALGTKYRALKARFKG